MGLEPEPDQASHELRRAFEECTLSELTHEDHVHLAFLYLREASLLTVLAEFPAKLKRYVTSRQAAGSFHATVTWTWILLVHERMRGEPTSSWSRFKREHADLFEARQILSCYSQAELDAPLARETFVLPRPRTT